MSKAYKYIVILFFLLPVLRTPVIGQVAVSGQVVVSGPACVIPRTVYQYVITGPWDSTSTMRVCLTGGQLADSSGICTPTGRPLSFVRVTWNAGSSGSLQVQSSKGNSLFSVTLSDTLTGGTIVVATKAQAIAYLATPALISCSASTGGACSPQYSYQWQQSADLVTWVDIPNDTTQNLTLTQAVAQSLFVRRKVTETRSNTVAFSDVARVDVGAPAPTISTAN
jgi:hypothetical protein